MNSILETLRRLLARASWVAPLLTRLLIGWVFMESGWGKLHNLSGVTEFFQSLGIPFAHLQAPFVAGIEFVGGGLLIVGLCTRLMAVPLSFTMIVAILTAKRADISSFGDLAGLSETLIFIALIWLLFYGAGPLSLDHVLFRSRTRRAKDL